MIFSDRQYAVSKQQINKLAHALSLVQIDMNKHEALRKIERSALQSQIADIERELADYELLRSGNVSFAESFSLADLPKTLIRARIAKGLSQTDLAERLSMKAQQVQRYEATEYMSASLSRLIEVAEVLNVRVSESFSAEGLSSENSFLEWTQVDHIDWSRFPLKEMGRRGWIKGANLATAAREWFLLSAGPQFASALHRKKVRTGSSLNEHALLAWQTRVLDLAHHVYEAGHLKEFQLRDSWISELVKLTQHEHGPSKAKELLNKHGIAFIVERHLSGTHLDGAAMVTPSGHPVVALTLRHDRLDNFWFVLFHELGHVYLHLFRSLRFDFFDEEDGREGDDFEREADRFALDKLIPEPIWRKCLSRFALTEEAVKIDADRLGVAPSIIAGRIRKERNDYRILSGLIGAGTVRSQLEEVG